MQYITTVAILFLSAFCMPDKSYAQCGCPPSANFNWKLLSDGLTIAFENISTGNDIAYQWTFGDGSPMSVFEHPNHTYASSGSYVVSLVVLDPCMLSSTHTQVITVQEGIPTSLWLTLDSPTLAAECQQVIFSANAVGGVPLAEHLGIRERTVFDLLESMRVMGADIRWCPRRRSYYYVRPGRFQFGWVAAEDISAPPPKIALNDRAELRGRATPVTQTADIWDALIGRRFLPVLKHFDCEGNNFFSLIFTKILVQFLGSTSDSSLRDDKRWICA